MAIRPHSAQYPFLFSRMRPVLARHDLTDQLNHVRTPHTLDRMRHPLETLPARRVVLGGYSPLGPGTFKRPETSRQ